MPCCAPSPIFCRACGDRPAAMPNPAAERASHGSARYGVPSDGTAMPAPDEGADGAPPYKGGIVGGEMPAEGASSALAMRIGAERSPGTDASISPDGAEGARRPDAYPGASAWTLTSGRSRISPPP